PYRQVTGGPVDYLMMDYLAEVTMSILQKQKARDPSLGYAKDFLAQMERILPVVVERRGKGTAHAGGVNPRGCAQAMAETARRLGSPRRRDGRRPYDRMRCAVQRGQLPGGLGTDSRPRERRLPDRGSGAGGNVRDHQASGHRRADQRGGGDRAARL